MTQPLEFPRIAYRLGGPWELEAGKFDVREVASQAEFDAIKTEGWRLDQYAAKDAVQPSSVPDDDAPVTRAELEQRARELGLKFDGPPTGRRLAELIAAKG